MQQDLNRNGERANPGTELIINENGLIPTKVFDHYEAIFYAFYNKEITFDHSDMSTALSEVGEIIVIAKYLGSLQVIGKPVESALIRHGQTFFRSVASKPALWITVSLDIKSELIFRESIIHLAGNWKKIKSDLATKKYLKDEKDVKMLVLKYHRILLTKVGDLDFRIASNYPGDMCKPVPGSTSIKREEYSKEILVWMALTFFRHWLSQQFIKDLGHNAPDCGFSLYQTLLKGGDAYMNREILNQFHAKIPLTKKAMNVLDGHLMEIKQCTTHIIESSGIMKNNLALDVKEAEVPYFTSTEFKDEDYPWVVDNMALNLAIRGVKHNKRPGGNDIAQQNLDSAKRQRGNESSDEDEDEELEA
jgi:hypothetical protein